MYLGFNAVVHIHETLPPDDTSMLWLKTIPIRTIVPTSEFLFESKIDVIDKTRQLFKIYEFESSPEVRVYSTSLERWETCSVENYNLISSDGFTLKDSNGVYLIY